MKAYLIDPAAKVPVTEIEWSGKFQGPNGGYELLRCTQIEAVRNISPQGDVVFIDEEAYYGETTCGFLLRMFPLAIKGAGLVVGPPGPEGEETEPLCSLEWLRDNVATAVGLRSGVSAVSASHGAMDLARAWVGEAAANEAADQK